MVGVWRDMVELSMDMYTYMVVADKNHQPVYNIGWWWSVACMHTDRGAD